MFNDIIIRTNHVLCHSLVIDNMGKKIFNVLVPYNRKGDVESKRQRRRNRERTKSSNEVWELMTSHILRLALLSKDTYELLLYNDYITSPYRKS